MISIVIPVYNEARIVRDAAAELCRRLDDLRWEYELILAENGSRDGTLQLLEKLPATLPRVRWLHEQKPNYGRALKRGILEARGEVVICDEIDLCDVDFYLRALPLLEQGADMVVGSKAMEGANDSRPWIRRVATRVINLLLRITTGFRGTDTHGLKAFKRERLTDVAPHRIAREAASVDRAPAPGATRAQWADQAGVDDPDPASVALEAVSAFAETASNCVGPKPPSAAGPRSLS